ncbi:uncharacterized protein KY384_000375 [Bacidia gigantensis]|uniref:uncharacterized protein n=1 Tax=Bacidia gigantensis TaxID=2732470 RepID=UPI001D044B8F|nr:uncharacterized protein KY384_000375 [Bacidia gigantensis]KAG8526381.1 hypothetical protein KY384_000375 [Bacidia gigantensis]
MFKKKPNIKPLAPLRSSDRRKIADQLIKDFDIEVPKHEEQGVEDTGTQQPDSAVTLTALRNSLLPENALSARFTTTAGPDLNQVSGTIYAGAHPGEEQRILWFKVEERLMPTNYDKEADLVAVYTLWKNPQICALLHTPDFVLQKLQTGAPLMTPGLANGPPFPSRATRDAVVAVASLERPSVPIAIGVCEIDIAVLGNVQGAKGHAVRTEHWEGDELWAWSTSGKPGAPPPEHIDGWLEKDKTESLEGAAQKLDIDDEDDQEDQGGVALPTALPTKKQNEHVEGEDIEPFEKIEEPEMKTEDINDAFWQAFVFGLYDTKRKHREDPNYGLNFPIPQSLVLSNLILPYLPIHTPAQAAALNIKKTTWKNLKKFMKALGKAQLIKCKERDGGECVILDVDFEDRAITTFTPYRLPKKDTPGADSGGGGGGNAIASSTNPNSDPSINQRLQKLILYRPKDSLAPIFSSANSSTKSLYLPPELRQITTTYIESENLISTTNKRLVTLNPLLANAIFDSSSSLDREVIAKGTVPRDALIDRVRESCTPFYAIIRAPDTRDTAKPKAGHPPKVLISLETRSGNKTVTKVSGLEAFYIEPRLLAEELQKSFGGQLAETAGHGGSGAGTAEGGCGEGVGEEGVDRGWVEVVDKTKGKKKR